MILDRLFGRKPKPAPPAEGLAQLPGDLWLDGPDALAQVEARRGKGALTEEQAGNLRFWVENGYMKISIDLADRVVEELESTVDRFWKEKPEDVPYGYSGLLGPMSQSDEATERRSPYRIMDMQSHSEAARELFLNRKIFDHVELIFGQPAVATQSIYFEYGSQQGLHRDPVFVQTTPPSHLVACWIALEDIRPGSGELMYVPGSHRMPWYEFAPGRWTYDFGGDGQEQLTKMDQFNAATCQRLGLREQHFYPKKGEVLLWHGSLLHGGAPLTDPSLTRRSFVVHFSTLANYKAHMHLIATKHPQPDGTVTETQKVWSTSRLLERDGCKGFDNPLYKT